MKVSELTAYDVQNHNRIDVMAEDAGLIQKIYLPAAISHVAGMTGLTKEQMDTHPDLALAVLALTADMYEHRGSTVEGNVKPNKTVTDIVDKYSSNLIPSNGGA